ncbi:MAG: universal stress protein [Bacteroidales bacterium]
MKKILVAIDFSKGSRKALKYALWFSKVSKAELVMVWVDNQTIQEGLFTSPSSALRQEARSMLEALVKKYVSPKRPPISFKIRRGKVYSEMSSLARTLEADLIICGTHGGSGFEKQWIGSNAYRIVTHAPCPVITVRYTPNQKDSLNRILLPIDNSNETLQKLSITAELAKLFGSEVQVVQLITDSLQSLKLRTEAHAREALKYMENQGIPTSFYSYSTDNITDTLLDHATNVGVDLISIMTEQESYGTGALLGPNARLIINLSPVPVLSSHGHNK